MTRRWPADGTKRADDAQMARKWSIYIFENTCIGLCAPKLFTKFFSLLFLRKEFLTKVFRGSFYILLTPKNVAVWAHFTPKNVTVWAHFDDVACVRGKCGNCHIHTTNTTTLDPTSLVCALTSYNIIVLPWPALSADMSPIEHLWDMSGRREHQRRQQPRTLNDW